MKLTLNRPSVDANPPRLSRVKECERDELTPPPRCLRDDGFLRCDDVVAISSILLLGEEEPANSLGGILGLCAAHIIIVALINVGQYSDLEIYIGYDMPNLLARSFSLLCFVQIPTVSMLELSSKVRFVPSLPTNSQDTKVISGHFL